MNYGPMLNAYPDSLGGRLLDSVEFLENEKVKGAFSSFYILPSLFNSDLDRGFSIISYELNRELACEEDLERLQALGIELKLDFVLNHASVLSPQFQDIIKKGQASQYKDFFINWNSFWKDCGTMTPEGYIQPDEAYIKEMFFRKPGLPLLMVRMPDGTQIPYWNTFYQAVSYPTLDPQDIMEITDLQYCSAKKLADQLNEALQVKKDNLQNVDFSAFETEKQAVITLLESKKRYLGQMDLNLSSPLVWDFYKDTLHRLAGYGAAIVRLDAFAYAPKKPGAKNFMNEPDTWEVLERIREMGEACRLQFLPEIHASYGEQVYRKIAEKGYMTYDFFLPGLLLYALEKQDGAKLVAWGKEIVENGLQVVNMLGCHDGIPLLDLKGLIEEEEILQLIQTIVNRGGYVKNLHGQKNMYYQVNATYFSALGEDERKMLLARAIQLFMPGKPQIWYLDLFAGKNDHAAVERAGEGGHKEINRTNLSVQDMETGIERDVVKRQLEMLRFRNSSPAFAPDARITLKSEGSRLVIHWEKGEDKAVLDADLASCYCTLTGSGKTSFQMKIE